MTQKSVREPHTALIIPDGRTRIYHTDPQLAKQYSKNKEIEREEIEIPAKNVFLGRMSSLCREYAEHFYPDNWFILTTNNQEGQPWLVHPDQPIKGEYDNPPYPIPGVPENSDKPIYWQPFIDQETLDNKLVNEAEKLGLLPKRDGADGQYSRIIFLGNGTDSHTDYKWWLQKTWDSCINNVEYESWFKIYQLLTKEGKKKDNGKASKLFAPYNTQKYQYSHYVEVIKALFKDTGIWLEFPLLDYEYESQMISRISDAIYRGFPLHHTPYSLEKISVNNLFRMKNPDFDYSDIPLTNSSHIQIITSPNGFGKSTIFRLIRAVFKGNLKEISSIPFDDATLTLSSGTEDLILSINKKYSPSQQEQGYDISLNTKPEGVEFTRKNLDDQFRDLKRWKEENQPKIKLLRKIIPPLPIRFLSSERLFHDPRQEKNYIYDLFVEREESNVLENKSRGEEFSESFKKRLDGVLTDYAIVSHKIDTTFPVRLLDDVTSQPGIFKDYDRLKESFSDLDKKRQQLETTDFLSFRNWYKKEKNPFESDKNDLHSVQLLQYQDFLHDYLEEQSEKYKVFDWINDRCQAFEDIINNLLIYTRIRIRKDTGFAFYNLHKESGRYHELDLHQISSGEMQQIVMYYDFLFNCDPSTVVLIDEPEISLHVNAQENLIENIEEIAQKNKLQFLIATHSPFVINSRWDITCDLLLGGYDE